MGLKLEEVVGKKLTEEQFDEAAGKKDACYHKVKARYDVWPSAYASGALVKCRKVGAKNWGNKSKKEGVNEMSKGDFLDSLFPASKVKKAIKIAHDMGGDMTGAVKKIEKYFKGMSLHTKVRDALQQANESVNENNIGDKLWEACWKGYEKKGMKKMFGKMYPNCVKKESVEEAYDIWMEDGSWGYTMTGLLPEAEYQGRKVKLGKPMQGDVKKFKVYVKNPKGNVVKVNFGQGGDAKGGTMRIRKSNPDARKNFRARHNCDSPGPRHKARYWSCRKW